MGKKSRRERRAEEKLEKGSGKAKAPGNIKATLIEYGKAIGTALVIALLLRQFVFQAFTIPTGSMEDTLQEGDFLFVSKFLYGAKSPERIRLFNWTIVDGLPHFTLPALRQPRQGDIIVFEYPENRTQDYIKRCVAVAGDTVRVEDGILHVNGEIYESNFADRDGDHSCIPNEMNPEACPAPHTKRIMSLYLNDQARHGTYPGPGLRKPHVVPEGHIFMMGDNRFNSRDSRYWGDLDTKLIKGKAMFIYWSWDLDKNEDKGEKIGFPKFNRIGDVVR
jgi:signal peptidase I